MLGTVLEAWGTAKEQKNPANMELIFQQEKQKMNNRHNKLYSMFKRLEVLWKN